MEPKDYDIMRGTFLQGPWTRDWPKDTAQIEALKASFKNFTPPVLTVSTGTSLSINKPLKAIGKRQTAGVKTQRAVMGDVSATQLAGAFWGSVHRSKGFQDAEWLHRSGFALGGLGLLGGDDRYKSSQTAENLIFGTSECNTHMLRAEMDILRVLSWAQRSLGLDDSLKEKLTGTVLTVLNREDQVIFPTVSSTQQIEGYEEKVVPPFMKNTDTSWLTPALDYAFVLELPALGQKPWLSVTRFNPFSRYRPTRFEAQLDKEVFQFALELDKRRWWPDGKFNDEAQLRVASGMQYHAALEVVLSESGFKNK